MKKKIILGAVVVALIAASASFAAWLFTSTGGSGDGRVAHVVAPTVGSAPTTLTGIDCLPGQSCSLQVQVNNPNTVTMTLTGVTYKSSDLAATFSQTMGGSPDAACPASNATVSNQTGLSISVAPGISTVTIPGAWTLSASAPVACSGDYVWFGSSAQHTYSFST